MGQDEPSELESLVYSSGEQGTEENRLGIEFLKMKEKMKIWRISQLWSRVLSKTKGAVLVLHTFGSLTRRIYLFGATHKIDLKPV